MRIYIRQSSEAVYSFKSRLFRRSLHCSLIYYTEATETSKTLSQYSTHAGETHILSSLRYSQSD